MLDADSGLFGGSFHGGETISAETLSLDGAVVAMGAGVFVADTIQINQTTTIDWTGAGGGSLQVQSSWAFDDDAGWRISATFTGQVNSGTFYAGMHSLPERFNLVAWPVALELSAAAAGFHTIPRSDLQLVQDPATGDQVAFRVALGRDVENIYGGVAVRKNTGVGAHNKLYYGPAIAGSVAEFTSYQMSADTRFQ